MTRLTAESSLGAKAGWSTACPATRWRKNKNRFQIDDQSAFHSVDQNIKNMVPEIDDQAKLWLGNLVDKNRLSSISHNVFSSR